MTKKILAIVLALVMCLCMFTACGGSDTSNDGGSADAATSGKIVFGTNAEFPPFEEVVTEGVIGEFDGIDMAIAKNIGDITGNEVAVETMEFDSLLVALQNGQIDAVISGMTITEERAKSVDFSEPYYTATQVMIVKEDSDIASAADMEGKGIAVVQGYTGETCVKDLGYEYTAFKKGTECIMELVNGKCDVVVIDSATAESYIADQEGLKIVTDDQQFEAEEYGIAVQKGNTELLDSINEAINTMKEDGTIDDIIKEYI